MNDAGPLKDEPGGVEKIQKIGRDFLQQSLKRGIDSIMGVTAKNAAYGRPQVEARSNFGRRRGRQRGRGSDKAGRSRGKGKRRLKKRSGAGPDQRTSDVYGRGLSGQELASTSAHGLPRLPKGPRPARGRHPQAAGSSSSEDEYDETAEEIAAREAAARMPSGGRGRGRGGGRGRGRGAGPQSFAEFSAEPEPEPEPIHAVDSSTSLASYASGVSSASSRHYDPAM